MSNQNAMLMRGKTFVVRKFVDSHITGDKGEPSWPFEKH